MRYHVLAADYDGTLARHGRVDASTWDALRRVRDSGRKLVMVTGRELDELLGLIDQPELFDRIVAENGALVYEPANREVRTIAARPPKEFIDELRCRGVGPIHVGRVIVATWEPHESTVLHVIHQMALELQVIFNKGAVMVLPTGVNKATGLAAALADLGMSPHNVVGIGDAENDHALLELAECGVAVSNALLALKTRADLVTTADHGAGVAELIDRLIADDLGSLELRRHDIELGMVGDLAMSIDPYSANIMVCGTSGSGKSTVTTGVLERLCRTGYQFAIVDPEGDYSNVDYAVVLGSSKRAPLVEEVLDVLKDPHRNVVMNMLGVAVDHRPELFAQMLPALADVRARTGRPHWLVIDEAHHLIPAGFTPVNELPIRPHGTLYVTVHPGSVAAPVLASINTLIALGDRPDQTLRDLCAASRRATPAIDPIDKLPTGHALYWRVGEAPAVVRTTAPKGERTRHKRKYIEGNLGAERAFYFRGPDGKLKLKAQNLQLFLQIGDGVDDDTWLHHLRQGDYSSWLRSEVKDVELADEIARIERAGMSVDASRAAVRIAVERHYTLPADKPSGIVARPTAV